MHPKTPKNSINIRLEFHFKGELHSPATHIALDDFIHPTSGLPDFHQLLAKRNNIDLLSYHYEIMLEEPIFITHAEGLVADFVTDGRLDETGFLAALQQQKMSAQLQLIAQQHLDIADLSQQPKLSAALTAAFRLGQKR
jgi:hypothetical protein